MAAHRVLFVITTSDFGGTESFLWHLVSRLDRQRFTPIVCTLCPPGQIGESIAASGVRVISLDMAARARPGELISGLRRLARLIDEQEIDLVQPLLYRANMLAVLSARLARRKPLVVSGQRSLNPRGARLTVLGVQLTRRLAHQIVAVSPAVRDEIARLEKIDPDKIEIIRNGVDTDAFAPGDRERARETWKVPSTALVIGAVGRLTTTKGFDHLLHALALLAARGQRCELLIAGSGPEEERLAALAHELDLVAAVRLVGFHVDLRSFYSALDIFALTSLAEGSPNALLEAMSSGCAVVATAVGGVLDIVAPEENGLLVPASDPASLAATLERLATDAPLRQRLGRGARQRVEEHFSVTRMVRHHAELYGRLLAARR